MSILEKGLSIGAAAEMGTTASELSKEMGGGNGQGGMSKLMEDIGQEGGGDSWSGGNNSLFGDSQDDDDDDDSQ